MSSASLGPITITLTDLDLTDGIASSITFAAGNVASNTSVSANAYQTNPNIQDRLVAAGTAPWSSLAESVSTPLASATASLTGSVIASPDQASLLATGASATPAPSLGYLSEYALYEAFAGAFQTGFTVTGNTKVTFSALASISGSAENRPNLFRNGDLAYSLATIDIFGVGSGGVEIQRSTDLLTNSTEGSYDGTVTSFEETRMLEASFENRTAGGLSGSVNILTWVRGYAYGQMAPVPEPGTYALLLVGLGMVGVTARRRSGAI